MSNGEQKTYSLDDLRKIKKAPGVSSLEDLRKLKKKDVGVVGGARGLFFSEDSSITELQSKSQEKIDESPWKDLPEEQRNVFAAVENYYTQRGWPSPNQKIQEYKDKEAKAIAQYEQGEIDEEEYHSKVSQAAHDIGVIFDEGKVEVPTGEMEMYNKLVERYYRQSLEERKEKEKDGFAKDVLDALNVGAARVLGLPTRIMAVSEVASNKILNLMGREEAKAPSYWQEQADVERDMVADMAERNQRYDATIAESIASGDIKTAAGQTILSIAETAPQLTLLIMGNAAGVTNATLGYMGADKAMEKYLQNEKDSDMGEITKVANAIGVGMSEVVFESLGTVKILNATKQAIRKSGVDAVRDQVLWSYTPYFQKHFSALNKGVNAAVLEGSSEFATQLTDNLMDRAAGYDVDLGDGVIDAFIVGAFIGKGLALPQMVAQHGGKNAYTKRITSVIPKDVDFDTKVELIDLLIKGDKLEYQIRNGAEATKDALKEELDGVKARVSEIVGEGIKGRREEILGRPVEVSEKPVEGVSPAEKGKVPPEGKRAEKQPQKATIKKVGDKWQLTMPGETEMKKEFDSQQEAMQFLENFESITKGQISYEEKRAQMEQRRAMTEEEEVGRPIAMDIEQDYGKEPPEGPPPEEGEALEEEPSDPVKKLRERVRVRKEELGKRHPSKLKKAKRFIDVQITDIQKQAKDRIMKIAKNIGEDALVSAQRLVNRITTQQGATGKSKVDLEDATTRVFGRGLNAMSQGQQALLGEVLSLQRSIEIENLMERRADETGELQEMKHEYGVTQKDAQELLNKIYDKDPAVLKIFGLKDYNAEKLRNAANEYYAVMREQLRKQYDNGLINEALYDKLREEQPYYSPRRFIQHLNDLDPGGELTGIKPLEGGSEEAAVVDPMTLMGYTIQKVNALIARNRTMQEMSKFAKDVPNAFIKNAPYSKSFTEKLEKKTKKEAETGEQGKFIEPDFASTPKGMEPVDYMENGQRERVWVEKSLWEDIEKERPGDKYTAAMETVSWLTGTPLLKFAATGMNPEFAVKNLLIDALHAWMTTDLYSNFMPKALFQLRRDYGRVVKDAWRKTGRYEEYAEEGGLMDFLTTQGKLPMRFGTHTKYSSSVKAVGNALARIGEFSEVWTRLALRERYIDNAKKSLGRDPTQEELTEIQRDATAAARNYLDFSQGGNVVKILDKFIPYLNAGVQVTRGSLRALYNDPKRFSVKLGQLVGLATTLTAWNLGHEPGGDDEEKEGRRNAYLNDIAPGVKARNFIIMTNFKYKDKAGNERYWYLKIPKDALQSSICALAEDIYAKRVGGADVDIMDEKMFMAMQNELRNITDLGNLPPVWRAAVGAQTNKDQFYKRDIWTGKPQPKDPRTGKFFREQEYYPGITPERFVKFGEVTGRSPVRTQYVMKQFFTENNIYVSLLGEVMDGLSVGFEENTKNIIEKGASEKVFGSPFVRRVAKSTYPQSGGELEAMELQDNAQKTANDHALDEIIMGKEDVEAAIADEEFNEFIEDIAEDFGVYEAHRMLDRAKQKWLKEGVSSSMIKIKYIASPEVRARAFHMLLKDNPTKENEFYAEAERLKINSDRFNVELGRLIDEEKGQTKKE